MEDLVRRMRDLGAPEPESWARSELAQDFAQQARFLFLRPIWPEAIDCWGTVDNIRKCPAGARLLDAGASPVDLATMLRAVAYQTAFFMLDRTDAGGDLDAPEDAPGWVLMETRDAGGEPTGRHLAGLHESILWLDPSGREGSDLWE
jgi:hypothetical protein